MQSELMEYARQGVEKRIQELDAEIARLRGILGGERRGRRQRQRGSRPSAATCPRRAQAHRSRSQGPVGEVAQGEQGGQVTDAKFREVDVMHRASETSKARATGTNEPGCAPAPRTRC